MTKQQIKRILYVTADWGMNLFLSAFVLVALWFIAHIFFVATFNIPTESMTPTIRPGDKILVDKSMMGARLYDPFAALNGERVNIHRTPGWRGLRRGDVIVFNFPHDDTWNGIAMHPTKYYAKRCLAIPGDTVSIHNCEYRINGEHSPHSNHTGERNLLYAIMRYGDDTEELNHHIVMNAYPQDSTIGWNLREFGPLYIPRSGGTIPLDRKNVKLYRQYIEWESENKLTIDSASIVKLGNDTVTEYTFTSDYCFVAGDNVISSHDSRYFGLVPVEYVVGRASCIYNRRSSKHHN